MLFVFVMQFVAISYGEIGVHFPCWIVRAWVGSFRTRLWRNLFLNFDFLNVERIRCFEPKRFVINPEMLFAHFNVLATRSFWVFVNDVSESSCKKPFNPTSGVLRSWDIQDMNSVCNSRKNFYKKWKTNDGLHTSFGLIELHGLMCWRLERNICNLLADIEEISQNALHRKRN